jgi:hypothetical protein
MARKKKGRKQSDATKLRHLRRLYKQAVEALVVVKEERNSALSYKNALGYFARKLERVAYDKPEIGADYDIATILQFTRTMFKENPQT